MLYLAMLAILITGTAAFNVTDCPAPRPPISSLHMPESCPPPAEVNADDRSSAHELQSGCPVNIDVGVGDHKYFKLNRTSVTSKFDFDWLFNDKASLILFAWHRQPYIGSTGAAQFEAYHLPLNLVGNKGQQPEVNNRDFYHLGDGIQGGTVSCGEGNTGPDHIPCMGSHPDLEHSGFLYITIVGYSLAPTERSTGMLAFDFKDPAGPIHPEQLQALSDFHAASCKPTQDRLPIFNASADKTSVNHRWRKEHHIEGVYASDRPESTFLHRDIFSTSGHERDPDRLPFCDWMYGVDVNSVTDCADLTDHGVVCVSGNIVELHVPARALKGQLPASFSNLRRLKKLDLSSNQLTGLELQRLLSDEMEHLNLHDNQLTGRIPCPLEGSDPAMKELNLGRNRFTGAFPACFFDSMPTLERISLNELDGLTPGPLPTSIKSASSLVLLSANNARRTGDLPLELGCLSNMALLSLARNRLSGELSQAIIDGMPRIYDLDVSFNQLSGAVPIFGAQHSAIHVLDLNNNRFSGELTTQLRSIHAHMDKNSHSRLNLAVNRFTGTLPTVFREVLTDTDPINALIVAGNKFRCEGNSDKFPEWVGGLQRLAGNPNLVLVPPSFGDCARAPILHRASIPVKGERMDVYGEQFEPSDELSCRIQGRTFGASWVSATHVSCVIPDLEVDSGEVMELAVANYGSDFSDGLPGGLTFSSPSPPPPPSPPPSAPLMLPKSPDRVVAIIAGAGSGGFVLLLLGVAFVLYRERQGRPLIQPYVTMVDAPDKRTAGGAAAKFDPSATISVTSSTIAADLESGDGRTVSGSSSPAASQADPQSDAI